MHATIAKRDLLRSLSRAQGIADKKATQPMLSCVLVHTVDDGQIRISATDLFVSVVDVVKAEVTKRSEGFAVNAKDIFDRVRAMPDGPVHIDSTDPRGVTFKAGTRKYVLRCMPADDFPIMPKPANSAPDVAISVAAFAGLLERAHFAMCVDEGRSHIHAALMEWGEGHVRMVATDGHRMSLATCSLPTVSTGSVLLPFRAVNELRRIFGAADGDESVTLRRTGSMVFVSHSESTFGAKLVDATFPPYKQVIPHGDRNAARVPRSAFADIIRSVSLAADSTVDKSGATNGAGVVVAFDRTKATITSESARGGIATDELPIEFSGRSTRVRFEPRYVVDVLGAIGDDEATIDVGGELDPIVFRPTNGDTFVVMPMRL